MNSAETAVAEHHDDVAALRAFGDVRDDGVHVGQIGRVLTGSFQILHQFFRVEPFFGRDLLQPRDLRHHDRVGIGKRAGQFGLKNIPACRVRARLEMAQIFSCGYFSRSAFSVSRIAVG